MRLVIVHRYDLGRLLAIFAVLSWRKDRAQSAKRENAKEERGFNRSRHGDVNLTRAVNSWLRALFLVPVIVLVYEGEAVRRRRYAKE